MVKQIKILQPLSGSVHLLLPNNLVIDLSIRIHRGDKKTLKSILAIQISDMHFVRLLLHCSSWDLEKIVHSKWRRYLCNTVPEFEQKKQEIAELTGTTVRVSGRTENSTEISFHK